MNIAIICVNYNSYDSLKNYLCSIDKAVEVCNCEVIVSVYIADNSTHKEPISLSCYKNIKVELFEFDNLGYLGGAFEIINSMSEEKHFFDYFIISNVDVTINNDFIKIFCSLNIGAEVAWVAPEIFVTSLNKVGNFEMTDRPSVKRMRFYNLLYSSVILFKIYFYLSRVWIKASSNKKTVQNIYSGYGSFMIFTRRFINSESKWEYPPFLFGEEIYFAEKARLLGMKVIFRPDLVINDIGKVSTGKIASSKKLRMQKESNLYLYNEFFRIGK